MRAPYCIWCDKTKTRTCCGANATRDVVAYIDVDCAEIGIESGQSVCRACLDEVWHIRAWKWTIAHYQGRM